MKKSEMIQRMRAVCATMRRDLDTERSYVSTISRFFDFVSTHPDLRAASAEQRVRAYLESIAPNVAASTQNVALNALIFFHRHIVSKPLRTLGAWAKAKRPERLPCWLTHEEAMLLLSCLPREWRLVGELCYSSGLRIESCVAMRIGQIDFGGGQIIIRGDKGNKDRVTLLGESIMDALRRQMEKARAVFDADRRENRPGVELPGSLERTRPSWSIQWEWFWIFPAAHENRAPRSGIMRRHHLLADSFGRALATAAKRANLDKRVNAHALRHSFATTMLSRGGCDIKKLSELLGHKDISTTARYLHCIPQFTHELRSPVDIPARNVIEFTGASATVPSVPLGDGAALSSAGVTPWTTPRGAGTG